MFSLVGWPLQVVSDDGSDLKKGLKNILQTSRFSFKVTSDITHVIAKLLRKKYQHHERFTTLLAHLSQTKQKILQTSLAYLMPLKERSKARFLNLPSIAKWTKQIIAYLQSLPKPSEEDCDNQEHLLTTFSWLFDYQEFLTHFWTEIQILSEIQKIVKTTGLNDMSYKKVCPHVQMITDAELRKPLENYLKTEIEFARQISHPILLTSDVIESLFGKYKYLAKPHSMSEINRMIFALPCSCQEITPELVKDAFSNISNQAVEQRCRQEISDTLLSKRRQALYPHLREKALDANISFISKNATLRQSIAPEYYGQKTVGTPLALTG